MKLIITTGAIKTQPKIIKSGTGKDMLVFSIALPEKAINNKPYSEHIDLTLMGNAINMQYSIGDIVSVTGEPSAISYAGKDGKQYAKLKVFVKDITILVKAESQSQAVDDNSECDELPNDDLPF